MGKKQPHVRDIAKTIMGQLGIKPENLIGSLESRDFNRRLSELLSRHSDEALGRIVGAVRWQDLIECARNAIAEAMAETVFAKPNEGNPLLEESEEEGSNEAYDEDPNDEFDYLDPNSP